MTSRRPSGRDERKDVGTGVDPSRASLERLALVHQIVTRRGEEGRDVIGSAELAAILGVDPTLVRKDMAQIGIVGRPRVGYPIAELLARLDEVLGLRRRNVAVLVGAGHLGGAIASYPGFDRYGLQIAAVLDIDPGKVGTRLGRHLVRPLERLEAIVENFRAEIAILTVPAAAAQDLADRLVALGIRAIWSFAPVQLQVPPGVAVRHENLALGLAQLLHQVNRTEER